jgi:hypothetical protein
MDIVMWALFRQHHCYSRHRQSQLQLHAHAGASATCIQSAAHRMCTLVQLLGLSPTSASTCPVAASCAAGWGLLGVLATREQPSPSSGLMRTGMHHTW